MPSYVYRQLSEWCLLFVSGVCCLCTAPCAIQPVVPV